MPGILPMKVIKVGSSAQSRIAQACDRCRSKKIRCDGIRPCCTQCANVGFECKTSDKLSRRAFPRGYTESLEDRVRSLEAEVRDLKELLDEKDEKIDLLSRIHSFSPASRKSSTTLSPTVSEEIKATLQASKDDTFHVEQLSPATDHGESDTNLGPSSTRAFVDTFKQKVQQTSKPHPDFESTSFFSKTPQTSPRSSPDPASNMPPRLVTDQLINIYFQEWAPLFPVLHRPTVLKLYEDFCSDSDALQSNKQAITQLFLVFSIAATSSTSRTKQDALPLQRQWQKNLSIVSSEISVSTLQSLVLAQIYFLIKADYANLARHKGVATGLCHQLGLHQSQRKYAHGALTRETRKRVFWCQYVLDRFSSAASGMPVLMKESDVHTEYPADVDDENVTEKGFLPTLPGESTRLSSALALFNLSRILTKVLEQNYPSAPSYDLSLSGIHALADELDRWLKELPSHLRLQFIQDKPSTNVISSRSPLLSLGYYYIRTLIHRPAIVLPSDSRSSASTLALADSSKHIIQILELLEERRMSFSFCLNRTELLLAAGFGLLHQCLDLKKGSSLVRDGQKLLRSVVDLLQQENAPGALTFKKLAVSLVSEAAPKGTPSPPKSSENSMSPPDSTTKSARKQLQAIASRFSFGSNKPSKTDDVPRRATVPRVPSGGLQIYGRNHSQLSISSAQSEPVVQRRSSPQKSGSINLPMETLNLDYFPLGTDPVPSYPKMSKSTMVGSDWERILSNMDSGNANIYDGIYGGPSPEAMSSYLELYPTSSNGQEWAPEAWPVNATDLQPKAPVPQSVLSFSDESLTSGEDLSSNGCQDFGPDSFKGILMPQLNDDFELEGLPGSWEF